MIIKYSKPADIPAESQDIERLGTLRPRTNRPNYAEWRLNLSTIEAGDDLDDFDDAMRRTEKALWLESMQEEISELSKLNVYLLVEKQSDHNIVSNRWVLRIKRSAEVKSNAIELAL